jgi:hypothetical protein
MGGSVTGGGRSGSGGGSGGVPGGGCGVGPCAEPALRSRRSKIGAPPVVFPVAVAGRLWALWAADLARLCRLRILGRSRRTRLKGISPLVFHGTNIGGNVAASTNAESV